MLTLYTSHWSQSLLCTQSNPPNVPILFSIVAMTAHHCLYPSSHAVYTITEEQVDSPYNDSVLL